MSLWMLLCCSSSVFAGYLLMLHLGLCFYTCGFNFACYCDPIATFGIALSCHGPLANAPRCRRVPVVSAPSNTYCSTSGPGQRTAGPSSHPPPLTPGGVLPPLPLTPAPMTELWMVVCSTGAIEGMPKWETLLAGAGGHGCDCALVLWCCTFY